MYETTIGGLCGYLLIVAIDVLYHGINIKTFMALKSLFEIQFTLLLQQTFD